MKSKVMMNSNIFEEVQRIMSKDPTKWSKIEKEIMNNYVRLTSKMIG